MTISAGQLFEDECARAEKIAAETGEKPLLLLHACCAPCSSAVLERLFLYFNVTLLYYNPNIYPREEYERRRDELFRFAPRFAEHNGGFSVKIVEIAYEPQDFYSAAQGFETEKEGGERCARCFELRLLKTAEYAAENGFSLFTTTLSISPHKNAGVLNAAGKKAELAAAEQSANPENVPRYLYADFKKKNGYKRSLEISAGYGLYRQNYCGCEFSMRSLSSQNR